MTESLKELAREAVLLRRDALVECRGRERSTKSAEVRELSDDMSDALVALNRRLARKRAGDEERRRGGEVRG